MWYASLFKTVLKRWAVLERRRITRSKDPASWLPGLEDAFGENRNNNLAEM